MRFVEPIQTLWEQGGPFLGNDRPSVRLTVEKSFYLNTATNNQTGWKKGPARWFQQDDIEQQIETEIPNVTSYQMDKSVDADAGNMTINIKNIKPLEYGEESEYPHTWGKKGFYTWSRGNSQESKARWGHSTNEWNGVLVPNALLRTYEGFGGHDLTIREAVEAGNIVLTGVWLIDEVSVSSSGILTVKCRDVGKLLIEQQLYPPLVPSRDYPLRYYRWMYDAFSIPKGDIPNSTDQPIGLVVEYSQVGPSLASSTDVTEGFNGSVHGHYPSDAFDDSPEPEGLGPGDYAHQATFWLSNGHTDPTSSDAFEWIEMNTLGQDVNVVYLHPFGGNYVVYISVWENGDWVVPEDSLQGGIIPYSGIQYTGDNKADIPYVFQSGITWEAWDTEALIHLPRTYKADKIRLTFSNLKLTQWGPEFYRVGVRKMFAGFDLAAAISSDYLRTFACCPYPKVDSDVAGYWQVRSNGEVFGYGDARKYELSSSNPQNFHNYWVIDINAMPDGLGYWTMDMSGRLIAYGSASHYGDSEGLSGYVGFAPTADGLGYWTLHRDGTVAAFGSATDLGNSSHSGTLPSGVDVWAVDIESHPTDEGFWVLWSDGYVDNIGIASHGNADRFLFSDTEYVNAIRSTSTGDGYWIVSGSGWVKAFGDAQYKGSGYRPWPAEQWVEGLVWDFVPNLNSDAGYAIQRANGKFEIFGDFEYFGSYAEGEGTLRKDGNYTDYADIIKELALWSGFYLYEQGGSNDPVMPPVYGNIESTGAYLKEDLPEEMFDKRPVIDAMTQIKEIVGYLIWIDQEGGFRFESPNWWSLGNYDIDGTFVDVIPEIDERLQLTDYSIRYSDQDARSEIIISTEDPTENFTTTLTTRVTPQTASALKGLVKPAMWVNGAFLDPLEQRIMAELIAMHIWFAQRMGQVTCVANPLIDINDQVKIFERTTGEVFVHYVRGVSRNFNFETGEYTMTLTTNWLGGSPFNPAPMFFACAPMPDGSGYWQARNDGVVWSFGNAEIYETTDTHLEWVIAMRSTLSGEGYYTMDLSGKIVPAGDAQHYGDLSRTDLDCIDFALTPTGNGYWILLMDGTVVPFGDATNMGDANITGEMPSGTQVFAHSIESHPQDSGYWILDTMGEVHEFGLSHHGNADRVGFRPTEYVAIIRRTLSGDGYWIVSGSGIVQAFGDADEVGMPEPYPQNIWPDGLVWDFIPNYDGSDGYALQHADGNLDSYGSFTFEGEATIKNQSDDLEWVIGSSRNIERTSNPDQHLMVSTPVIEFLSRTSSQSAKQALSNHFSSSEPTFKA